MVDIQSATAEIRREKKEGRRTNDRMTIYMACPITQGVHKKTNYELFTLFNALPPQYHSRGTHFQKNVGAAAARCRLYTGPGHY